MTTSQRDTEAGGGEECPFHSVRINSFALPPREMQTFSSYLCAIQLGRDLDHYSTMSLFPLVSTSLLVQQQRSAWNGDGGRTSLKVHPKCRVQSEDSGSRRLRGGHLMEEMSVNQCLYRVISKTIDSIPRKWPINKLTHEFTNAERDSHLLLNNPCTL